MSEIFSKSKYKTIIIIALLVVFYLIVHMPVIKAYRTTTGFSPSKGQRLDDRTVHIGDYTYYLHGALSIFDFEVEKKFNDKYYPIIGQQRRIVESDMPWYAKYVLAFYPNPSFKFGYSLSAALITAPLPQSLFGYHIHRLLFVNIIFIIMTITLIFLIVKKITGDYAPSVIASLFFIFDVSNTHNSYSYMSHTISGIFYLLLAYFLFIKGNNTTPALLGLISFLLVFAILSSSHVVPLAVFMGLFIYLYTCYKGYLQNKLNVLKFTLAGIIGSAIWPLYIIGVEKLFNFKKLGLPTTLAQLEKYRFTINELIETFPVYTRFMWDLRVFNIFIVPILFITIFIVIYQKYFKRIPDKPNEEPYSFSTIVKHVKDNKKYFILLLTILLATAVTAPYSIPVSRSMTVYTVLYGVLFGIFLGKRFTRGNMIVKVLTSSIVFLLFLNFNLTLNVINMQGNKPSNNIIVIDENEIIDKNANAYYRQNVTDAYEYNMISKSIKEFIEKYDSQKKEERNTYIEFDGMYLVNVYSNTRRFTGKTTPRKRDVVTKAHYLKDFLLLAEIFALYQKGLLSDSDIIRRKKSIWNFMIWDQEYNYIYAYCNYVSDYIKGTPLESLDPAYVYYINYEALKKAILKEESKGILEALRKEAKIK